MHAIIFSHIASILLLTDNGLFELIWINLINTMKHVNFLKSQSVLNAGDKVDVICETGPPYHMLRFVFALKGNNRFCFFQSDAIPIIYTIARDSMVWKDFLV